MQSLHELQKYTLFTVHMPHLSLLLCRQFTLQAIPLKKRVENLHFPSRMHGSIFILKFGLFLKSAEFLAVFYIYFL